MRHATLALAISFTLGAAGCSGATNPDADGPVTVPEQTEDDPGGKGDQLDDDATDNYGFLERAAECREQQGPERRKECLYEANRAFADAYRSDLVDAGAEFDNSSLPDPLKAWRSLKQAHLDLCRLSVESANSPREQMPFNRCHARTARIYPEIVSAHRGGPDAQLQFQRPVGGSIGFCYGDYERRIEDADGHDARLSAAKKLASCIQNETPKVYTDLYAALGESGAAAITNALEDNQRASRLVCRSLVGEEARRVKCRADALAATFRNSTVFRKQFRLDKAVSSCEQTRNQRLDDSNDWEGKESIVALQARCIQDANDATIPRIAYETERVGEAKTIEEVRGRFEDFRDTYTKLCEHVATASAADGATRGVAKQECRVEAETELAERIQSHAIPEILDGVSGLRERHEACYNSYGSGASGDSRSTEKLRECVTSEIDEMAETLARKAAEQAGRDVGEVQTEVQNGLDGSLQRTRALCGIFLESDPHWNKHGDDARVSCELEATLLVSELVAMGT